MPAVESRIRIGYSNRFWLLALEVVERHQDRGGGADQRQELEEAGEALEHEAAAEGLQPFRRQPDDHGAGRDQQQDRRAS